MGLGSTGNPSDHVYSLALEAVWGSELAARPDPRAPFVHAFLEPGRAMSQEDYESALVRTRPQWRQVWP
jgi:hypothetical protein